MSPEEFKMLLSDWQRWYFHDHTLRGLGFAQGGYAERVGSSYSTNDPADDIDLDIARWHDFFRRELPESVRALIWVEYLTNGKKTMKHVEVNLAPRDYGPALKFAIETSRQMFNKSREMRKEVA